MYADISETENTLVLSQAYYLSHPLSVCVCVHIHVYMWYVYMCVHVCVHMHVYMCTYGVYGHAYVYVVCVHMHVYMWCVCAYAKCVYGCIPTTCACGG